jgi:hypothetical protein
MDILEFSSLVILGSLFAGFPGAATVRALSGAFMMNRPRSSTAASEKSEAQVLELCSSTHSRNRFTRRPGASMWTQWPASPNTSRTMAGK